MLIWYTKEELIPSGLRLITNNDCFFLTTLLSDDEITKRILLEIDKADYNSNWTFIGRDKKLGALDKNCLSTGVKTLLNMYKHPDACISLAECGVNAVALLIDLSNEINGYVYLPYPVVPYIGSGKCSIYCDNVLYTNYEVLSDTYYYVD
jgi:hypothetical protein